MRNLTAVIEEFNFNLISMGPCPMPRWSDASLSAKESTAVSSCKLSETEKQAAIELYLPLVKQIAGKLMRSLKQCDFDDLVSDGIFGLMKAVEQFDPGRGVKFETYANPVIRGAILNGLRAMDWVPERKRIKARELHRAMDKLISLHGREGTSEELAQELKVTAQDIYELIADLGTAYLLSLDQPISSSADEDRSFLDTIQDERSADPCLEMEFQEQHQLLLDYLGMLPEREKMIVQMHYFKGISFEEIARTLSISKQRVSQVHATVLRKLRLSFSDKESNAYSGPR